MNHGKGCQCPVCRSTGAQSLFEKVDSNIRKFGFHITGVFEDDDTSEPTFSYTAGLETSYGHPEILVIGIDYQVAAQLMRSAVDQIRNGTKLTAGQQYLGIANMPVIFGTVPEAQARAKCRIAYEAQPGLSVRVLQMVWPDQDGRFPHEPEYDHRFDAVQPILGTLLGSIQ